METETGEAKRSDSSPPLLHAAPRATLASLCGDVGLPSRVTRVTGLHQRARAGAPAKPPKGGGARGRGIRSYCPAGRFRSGAGREPCSWKDGDPHCSIRTYRGKRAVGEKKKGTSATAGRPPCGRKDSAQDRARLERERRRAFYSLFKAPRRSASEPVTRANRPAKADGGSKGEQESLPPKHPLLPRSLFASCCFLASCVEIERERVWPAWVLEKREACWGPPLESSSAAIGGGEGHLQD
uniref:Uncharacterized protein n=1 Tax=Setaria viridis TaxID=4556 RepID=A0A4U6T9R4_SETVI|nr:hypothetical protein SEVIR_9G503400v2 [Setaria viridis]